MSILGPFLFAAMIVLPIWFATLEDKEIKVIAVADSSYTVKGMLKESEYIKFMYLNYAKVDNIRNLLNDNGYWGVLFISPNILNNDPVILYSFSQPSIGTSSFIQNAIYKEVVKLRLIKKNISKIDDVISAVNSNINLRTIKINEKGEAKEVQLGLKIALGYIGGFLIYIFIFLFGSMVMRGVIEEKTSRIVEVIVSSVKPFELMMGKIIGIAGVGLLQFLLWVIFTFGIVYFAQKIAFPQFSQTHTERALAQDVISKNTTEVKDIAPPVDENLAKMEEVYKSIGEINFGVVFGSFIFFFLGGYLLYASLFASIGSAVDTDSDVQQFMLPITIPLILSIYVMINTINNPESALSFWFSIIPFTSPIVMMVRIPFGVPYWEVTLSVVLLIGTFILTTWLASKIYRTGILMYGKKSSYKELWKWIKYKN
jgi:ABC-2 type transport system permease protein